MSAIFDSIRFFYGGHVNTIEYRTKSHLLEKLKTKITNAISNITVNHLASVLGELQNPINLCISNDGGHEET